MTRGRPTIRSGFVVLGSAGLLFACFAGAGCAEGKGEGHVDTQSVALEDDPLDGKCSRIVWEHMPNRYLDAYTTGNGDVVTRTFQDSATQLWCFTRVDSIFTDYTIQHRTFSGQFLDAYGVDSKDYRVVLRDAAFSKKGAPHLDQVWRLWGRDRLYQVSTGRYLDGHTSSSRDYRAVTRSFQADSSQNWDIESLPIALPEDPSCDPAPTGSAACEPKPPCTPPMGSFSGTCQPPAP